MNILSHYKKITHNYYNIMMPGGAKLERAEANTPLLTPGVRHVSCDARVGLALVAVSIVVSLIIIFMCFS